MTIKEQFGRIKENWFLILLPFILVFILMYAGNITNFVQQAGLQSSTQYELTSAKSTGYPGRAAEYMPAPSPSYKRYEQDFAPEQKERLIAKTAEMTTEVEKGTFKQAESQLKSIVHSSESYILNENVDTYHSGEANEYAIGRYDLKIDTKKYDSIVLQLKEIGKVTKFNQESEDVTGRHTDLNVELENENKRLERYHAMYKEATDMEDKIDLSDRIFDFENRIKYLQESTAKLEKQVTYSTINVQIREKTSEYVDIEFVKLPEITSAFVGSLNLFLIIAVAVIPWLLAYWLVKTLRNKHGQQQKKGR
ncbi:MAG: DUF4349 domain-containing protein [Candidatus Aenigmarchaeota archaeon]|nr:DUF4349 domain-containing protein [Candidatus Aenigmarchaeota archaeon]